MILINESPDRATHEATSKVVDCPECGGRGEVVLEERPVSNYPGPNWEPWEPDTRVCLCCDGSGQVELVRCQGVECSVWFDPREALCVHGEPVCDEHRHDCAECMLDARDAS